MSKTIWMLVTRDEYELPLAVANSAEELARITGKSANTIKSSAGKYKKGLLKTCSYRRVDLEEDKDDKT